VHRYVKPLVTGEHSERTNLRQGWSLGIYPTLRLPSDNPQAKHARTAAAFNSTAKVAGCLNSVKKSRNTYWITVRSAPKCDQLQIAPTRTEDFYENSSRIHDIYSILLTTQTKAKICILFGGGNNLRYVSLLLCYNTVVFTVWRSESLQHSSPVYKSVFRFSGSPTS